MSNSARIVRQADIQIGSNIRKFRLLRDMTQMQLALQLGIAFQQIQKYENGRNRVPGSRLVEIATIFRISMDQLCEVNLPASSDPVIQLGLSESGIKLARQFDRMSKRQRQTLIAFLSSR